MKRRGTTTRVRAAVVSLATALLAVGAAADASATQRPAGLFAAVPGPTVNVDDVSPTHLYGPGTLRGGWAAVSCTAGSDVSWHWTLRAPGGAVVVESPAGRSADGMSTSACLTHQRVFVDLDGTDGAANTLPDGVYSLEIAATDAGGRVGSTQTPFLVDTRTPAVLVSPNEGATLTGVTNLTLAVTAGVTVTHVKILQPMIGQGNCTVDKDVTATDGSVTVPVDVTRCPIGSQWWAVEVTWVDAGGNGLTFTTGVHVTVDDVAPMISDAPSSMAITAFAPGGNTFIGGRSFDFVCTDDSGAAWIGWQLTDSAGRVVNQLQPTSSSSCASDPLNTSIPYFGFDGTDLPDGIYHLRVTATDAQGKSSSREIPVLVQLTPPGFLVAPLDDDELAGVARFTYVPDPSGPPTTEVSATVGATTTDLTGPDADALWRGSVATSGLPAGDQLVSWTATWTDPWGNHHSYTEGGIPVTVDPTGTPPVPTAAPATVYRFWSPRFNNAHFFTMDAAEAQHIRTYDRNWTYESTAFAGYPADAGQCGPGTEPVHRFWSPVFTSHFFTASADEAARIIAGDRNWTYEGVAYCAPTSQVAGSVPLYRFWSPKFSKHFFTSNAAEAYQLDVNDPNWDAEGIAYFVQPSAAG